MNVPKQKPNKNGGDVSPNILQLKKETIHESRMGCNQEKGPIFLFPTWIFTGNLPEILNDNQQKVRTEDRLVRAVVEKLSTLLYIFSWVQTTSFKEKSDTFAMLCLHIASNHSIVY